jgi:hypothetical protein
MAVKLPARAEVLSAIGELRAGTRSREEVSAWAFSFIDNNDIEITDPSVWRVLKYLGATDLPEAEGYLYGDEDFSAWASELES